MDIAVNKNTRIALQLADFLLLVGVLALAFCYPPYLMSTQGYVAAVIWFISIILVGGQNPRYLYPRYGILISMGLSLFFTAVVGIIWAGSGWSWYMKGGLEAFAVLAVGGMLARYIIAQYLRQPTIQVVPFRTPDSHLPLLAELSRHPLIHVENSIDDPAAPLPEPRPGYTTRVIAGELRLRESTFNTLMPLLFTTDVVDLVNLYESIIGKAALIDSPDGWVVVKTLRQPSPMRRMTKRVFDVCFVLLTAPITLPTILLAALVVKLTSPGPVFFRQSRLGRHGKPFNLIKLRTMVVDAEAFGPRWSGADDPRITPIGRFLRTSGIDELPQFWNVLRGELSLIGPRPECPTIAERLAKNIPLYQARLLQDPGLTGWAQLNQGSDTDLTDVRSKLAYDLYYMQNISLSLDCQILLGTIQMILHLAKPAPRKVAAIVLSPSQV